MQSIKPNSPSLSLSEQSCDECGHKAVCVFVQAMAKIFINNVVNENCKPFEITDLAKICRFYLSDANLQLLTNGI